RAQRLVVAELGQDQGRQYDVEAEIGEHARLFLCGIGFLHGRIMAAESVYWRNGANILASAGSLYPDSHAGVCCCTSICIAIPPLPMVRSIHWRCVPALWSAA